MELRRCVRRSSGTRFVLWGKWPEFSPSSGLTPSFMLSLWCSSSFLMVTLYLEKAYVHVCVYIWITMSSVKLPERITRHHGARERRQERRWNEWSQSSAQWSCVWKHNVVLLGLMSWHEISHDPPRLYNDIRHYSRLMLLPLRCHKRVRCGAAHLFQTSACGSVA